MSRNKKNAIEAESVAMQEQSRQAENSVAASTDENRNQKGHIPNSPSTG
ncbi:hypothetical protein K0T92_05980 [Paenibacillus oenotherae]|uniref:Uncharacterized protein n=1 Tax=Paenibacillus oenotherae TaxID=1435645 RepID=A0ABS7D343_9BACL|nr:hypothetical protein [Paenibacillus oenotherae]MBW7474286.1 hypothetical protein [Paenibacillus oenotherae]